MSLHLQRLRLSVRTKDETHAGTNSRVRFYYYIEDDHNHPKMDPGEYSEVLDHRWHDDFKRGAIDSYEIDLAEGSSGRERAGTPVPNGICFRDIDHAREMKFVLEIEGSDLWVLDRYVLAGYFKEMRPIEGEKEAYEVVDLGWLEMAKHNGDIAMSADESEGVDAIEIAVNGKFE